MTRSLQIQLQIILAPLAASALVGRSERSPPPELSLFHPSPFRFGRHKAVCGTGAVSSRPPRSLRRTARATALISSNGLPVASLANARRRDRRFGLWLASHASLSISPLSLQKGGPESDALHLELPTDREMGFGHPTATLCSPVESSADYQLDNGYFTEKRFAWIARKEESFRWHGRARVRREGGEMPNVM